MSAPADDKFERLVDRLEPGSRLVRAWALAGGVSAQVTALEVERPDGEREKMIVRQYGPVDLKQNPRIAADEYRLLRILRAAGLAVPAPYACDESGEIFATPYVAVEYIEGEAGFAPANLADYSLQVATHLSRIHALDGSQHELAFLPRQENKVMRRLRSRPVRLGDSLDEGRIRDALEAAWPLAARNKVVLLHGDYWPGNILWNDDRLVGIVDWEDAALGDPLADLANTRLELLWAFGGEAMQQFTRDYLSLSSVDTTDLAYWELYAALRPVGKLAEWAADAVAERKMREGHRWFVQQAFAALSVSG